MLQKTLVTATVIVLAGTGIYEARHISRLRERVNALEQQQTPLMAQIQELQRERDEAVNQIAALHAERAQPSDEHAELLRLRGMAGVARRATAEAEQLRAQLARQSNEGATNPITGAMADAMKLGLQRQLEGRLSRMITSLRLTGEQTESVREILSRQTEAMSAGMQQAFSGKFDKDELQRLSKTAGNIDEQMKAVLTPDQQAAYPTYQQEEAAHNASLAANSELVQMQTTLGLTTDQLDRVYPALYEVTFKQVSNKDQPAFPSETEAMQAALDQKLKALEPLLTETQLENYRQQQGLQIKMVKDIINKMQNSRGAK
jgi:predicted HicB family RNase H-like nuclease